MHLHIPRIPRPFMCIAATYRHTLGETAWYFYKLPIIDRGEANCFQRGRRAACLRPVLSALRMEIVAVDAVTAKKKAERTKQSFICVDSPRTYVCGSFSVRIHIRNYTLFPRRPQIFLSNLKWIFPYRNFWLDGIMFFCDFFICRIKSSRWLESSKL